MKADITSLTPDKLLTIGQTRSAKAWAMVQTQPKGQQRFAFTVREIANRCGVGIRTVADMRAVDTILRARGERDLGSWPQARRRAFAGRIG